MVREPPRTRETRVQTSVESYQRLEKKLLAGLVVGVCLEQENSSGWPGVCTMWVGYSVFGMIL